MRLIDLNRAPVADPHLVETLEGMLAMARTGELRGMLAVGFVELGRIRWSAGAYHAPDALWALEQIKVDMLRHE